MQEERAFPRNPEFIADDDLLNQPELEPVYNGKKRSNVSELILLSPSIVTMFLLALLRVFYNLVYFKGREGGGEEVGGGGVGTEGNKL